ncbi:MAG: hypothetical protein HAW67_01205, partial [Endozoicomonadaceae bacterium]|nr:hypothetical protein [Endozoicomonadaceae bacterium]
VLLIFVLFSFSDSIPFQLPTQEQSVKRLSAIHLATKATSILAEIDKFVDVCKKEDIQDIKKLIISLGEGSDMPSLDVIMGIVGKLNNIKSITDPLSYNVMGVMRNDLQSLRQFVQFNFPMKYLKLIHKVNMEGRWR